MHLKKNAEAAIREAAAKVDAFVAASRGDESRCAAFRSAPGMGVEAFTEAQKQAVRIYVESWIQEPLQAALASIDGKSDFSNELYLDSIKGRP